MLTPDLIRPHIRNGCIGIPRLTSAKRERLLSFAQELLHVTREKVGSTREDWQEALDKMERPNKRRMQAFFTAAIREAKWPGSIVSHLILRSRLFFHILPFPDDPLRIQLERVCVFGFAR